MSLSTFIKRLLGLFLLTVAIATPVTLWALWGLSAEGEPSTFKTYVKALEDSLTELALKQLAAEQSHARFSIGAGVELRDLSDNDGIAFSKNEFIPPKITPKQKTGKKKRHLY